MYCVLIGKNTTFPYVSHKTQMQFCSEFITAKLKRENPIQTVVKPTKNAREEKRKFKMECKHQNELKLTNTLFNIYYPNNNSIKS